MTDAYSKSVAALERQVAAGAAPRDGSKGGARPPGVWRGWRPWSAPADKDNGTSSHSAPPALPRLDARSMPPGGLATLEEGHAHEPELSRGSAPVANLSRPSTTNLARGSSVIHREASNKLMLLSTNYRTRRQLEESEGVRMPPWVVHPLDMRAHVWWAFILMTTLVTMVVEPYCLAFAAYPGLYPPTSPDTILTILLMAAFAADIVVNGFVAFYNEDGELVTGRREILVNYAKWRLWLDLATTIPFDWIVLSATGLQSTSSTKSRYISLLRLLRLGRAYRLKKWAVYLTNNASMSLLVVTLVRNALLIFFTTHLSGCLFYYIARQTDGLSWLEGLNSWAPGGQDIPVFQRYIYSLYFATVTFATVGYGDVHAYTVAEAVFLIVVININVVISAYLIGTITLLVTRSDEETGRYRAQLGALKAYSATHNIPKELQSAMRGHLRLYYSAQEASDEQVLAQMPSALRRRVLRHMYLSILEDSWLLKGARQKYLDALLGTAKVEHVMEKTELISEGDAVNELIILVAGSCVVEVPRPQGAAGGEHVVLDLDLGSVHGGSARSLEPGDPLGEAAFFTETQATEAVRTLTVCRILSLSRTAYMALAASFPMSTATMLSNLMKHAEEMVQREYRSAYAAGVAMDNSKAVEAAALRTGWFETGADSPLPGLVGGATVGPSDRPRMQRQQLALSNLVRVRMLVDAQRRRLQRERTAEFLEAAAAGNTAQIRAMLQQGMSPDSCDVDGRTALMLAAGHGATEAVGLLLTAGADPNKVDASQSCALLEAARGGHQPAMDALLAAGGKVTLPPVAMAAELCTAVFDGNTALLRRLLRSGLDPDAGDYDMRRAAHIAAAEGALALLKALVEEAGADVGVKDRWGATPLDEARRCGATAVVGYLEGLPGGGGGSHSSGGGSTQGGAGSQGGGGGAPAAPGRAAASEP